MNLKIQVLVVALYVLWGCRPTLYNKLPSLEGSSESKGPQKVHMPSPVTVYTHKEKPVFYTLADTACSEELALSAMGRVSYISEAPGRISGPVSAYLKNTSGYGLSNPHIKGVYKNFHIRVTYDNCTKIDKNLYQCKKATREIINKGEKISLCKRDGYPRNSLENAALNIASTVTAFVSKLDQNLTPLEIMIHPKQEFVIHTSDGNISFFNVNNAFWTNMARDESQYSKGLYFLPHSENFVGSATRKLFYWEQPGVVAHETAHHAFYEGTRGPQKLLSNQEDGLFESFENLEDHINYFVSSRGVRVVSGSDVVAAVNEGLSDALSRATIARDNSHDDPNYGAILISPTQIKARDIFSSINDDGSKKQLGADELRRFLKASISRPVDPATPNQQDVHTIGAIIARGVTGLVALKYPDVTHLESHTKFLDELVQVFTQWPKKITPYLTKKADGALAKEYLQDILLEVIKSTGPSEGVMLKSQCDYIYSYFPVYAIEWQNLYQCVDR